MAISFFTSAYKALAHGVLNWDTQLRTDMGNLETAVNASIGENFALGYAGTVTEFGGGRLSQVRRTAQSTTLLLNINPGANGLSAGGSNSLVANVPAAGRPYLTRVIMRVEVYESAAWGKWALLDITTDGNITVTYVSGSGSIANGALVCGSITWPLG